MPCNDWHYFAHRIDALTSEIEALVKGDDACQRLMTIPGVGPLTASAMVAAVSPKVTPAPERNPYL